MPEPDCYGQVAQLVEQRTENPCVGGSNPPLPIQECGFSPYRSKELVSGLFYALENDPELRLIVESWPNLPEHIKAAIKALVQTHTAEKK